MNYKYLSILLAVLLACSVTGSVYAEKTINKEKYQAIELVQCPNCGNHEQLDHWGCGSMAAANRWQCPKCGCLFTHEYE